MGVIVIGVGADADELDRISGVLGHAADLLDARRSTLSGQVHHAPWTGHEADRFRHNWDHQYVPSIVSAAAFLRSAVEVLRRNAHEQRVASSFGGSSSVGSAVGNLGAGVGAGLAGAGPWIFGKGGSAWKGLVTGTEQAAKLARFLNPANAPMMILATAPAVLSSLHLRDIRIGDKDNHVIISRDGTVSFKAGAIKTEVTGNVHDSSFKVQVVGLGLEKTGDGAYGVLVTPGVHIGPVQLQAGLDVTYNPKTGVIAPSGTYDVGIDHVLATHGSIHEQINPATGNIDKQVEAGYDVGPYSHEVTAAEHNDDFVSTSSTDSVTAGPVTVSQTHTQALTPDGTYSDSVTKTQSISTSASLDSTYFAATTDSATLTHSDVTTTSTTADGTRTTTHTDSTSQGGW